MIKLFEYKIYIGKNEPMPLCWKVFSLLFMTFMMLIMMVLCISCQSDDIKNEETVEYPAVVRLKVTGQEQVDVATRAVNEDAINDLHILIYDSKGELIGQQYATSSTVAINTHSAKDCTIYAIANTGKPNLLNSYNIHTEATLKELTCSISSWDELTNQDHLPMTGSMNKVEIVAGTQTLLGGMKVSRMVAKITLDIKIKKNSGITITDYSIYNIPLKSYYIGRPLATEDLKDDTNTMAGSDAVNAATSADWTECDKVTVNAASTICTFYMFETRRGVVESIKEQQNKVSKDAPARATYIVINGKIGSVTASWKVYLGGNATSNFNIKRNSTYTYSITLYDVITADTRVNVDFTNVIDLSVTGIANCYLASQKCTWYKIKATVRGNGAATSADISPTGTYLPTNATISPTDAELVWEGSCDDAMTSKGIIQTLFYKDEYIYFKTGHIEGGNAVIAAKDVSGTILWSWHIWKTSFDLAAMPTQTYKTNPRKMNANFNNGLISRFLIMMDRNLGATSNIASNTNQVTETFGLFYQFGRKDPFPSPKTKAGLVGVYGKSGEILNNETLSSATYQIKNNIISAGVANNITYAINHPLTFITNDDADTDADGSYPTQNWIYGAKCGSDIWKASNKLWGSEFKNESLLYLNTQFMGKTIYDPCPQGWCMPPDDTWTNFTTTLEGGMYDTANVNYYNSPSECKRNWTIEDDLNSLPVYGRIFYISGTSGEKTFYPASGYRYGSLGLIINVGYYSCVWSAAPVRNDLPYSQYFYAYNAAVIPVVGSGRSSAYPVRCVKESSL